MSTYTDNVSVILATLSHSNAQMLRIDQVMSDIQGGLMGVEQEMLPIYQLTEKLRVTQKNIDLCVGELARVREHFVVGPELSATLLRGTASYPEQYLRALDRLLEAIAFLESHRSYEGSSKALDQAKDLLASVQKDCKLNFQSIVSLLLKVHRDERREMVWRKPQESEFVKAKQMVTCLLRSKMNRADIFLEYVNQRILVIRMYFPWLNESQSAKQVPSDLVAWMKETLSDIIAIVAEEKQLAQQIFVDEHIAHTAFCGTCSPLLNGLKTILTLWARKAIKADYLKLLLAHEVVFTQSTILSNVLKPPLLLQDNQGDGINDPRHLVKLMTLIIHEFALATKESLFASQMEIVEHVGITDRLIPRDGNVHAASSLMLRYIRQLCQHIEVLKLLLTDSSPQIHIESAVMQLVEALQSSSAKCRADLRQMFQINNLGFLVKAIKSLSISDESLTNHLHSEIIPRFEIMIEHIMEEFIKDHFRCFETILQDPIATLQYMKSGNALTLESGRILKEKFKKFNSQLEELVNAHRHLIVIEPDIRHRLTHLTYDMILSRYTAFYAKYSAVPFSRKNGSKYLKYTPEAVGNLRQELYRGELSTMAK